MLVPVLSYQLAAGFNHDLATYHIKICSRLETGNAYNGLVTSRLLLLSKIGKEKCMASSAGGESSSMTKVAYIRDKTIDGFIALVVCITGILLNNSIMNMNESLKSELKSDFAKIESKMEKIESKMEKIGSDTALRYTINNVRIEALQNQMDLIVSTDKPELRYPIAECIVISAVD
jgi:hypothetical protein